MNGQSLSNASVPLVRLMQQNTTSDNDLVRNAVAQLGVAPQVLDQSSIVVDELQSHSNSSKKRKNESRIKDLFLLVENPDNPTEPLRECRIVLSDGTFCGRRYANTSSSSTLRYHLTTTHPDHPDVQAKEEELSLRYGLASPNGVGYMGRAKNKRLQSAASSLYGHRAIAPTSLITPPPDVHFVKATDAQQAMEIVETFLWERGLRPHKMLFQSVKREVFAAWVAETRNPCKIMGYETACDERMPHFNVPPMTMPNLSFPCSNDDHEITAADHLENLHLASLSSGHMSSNEHDGMEMYQDTEHMSNIPVPTMPNVPPVQPNHVSNSNDQTLANLANLNSLTAQLGTHINPQLNAQLTKLAPPIPSNLKMTAPMMASLNNTMSGVPAMKAPISGAHAELNSENRVEERI